MKKVFLGLFLGLLLSGIIALLMVPKVKQAAYGNCFNAGNKQGVSTGTAAGIAQGIAQVQAHEQHEHDSVTIAETYEAARLRAAYKPHKVVKPVQNWHVIDGKIADPVTDQPQSATKS